MQLLLSYLRRHKKTLAGALALAVVNQVFSLLDPQIFRLIIDNYATRAAELAQGDFVRGVLFLLGASVGVSFVSRVAKNFQDYYVNVITQRVGAELYNHSVAHAFSLPYGVFEDQRSGEILQKLQKARTDSQAFVTGTINVLFISLVGIIFVLSYAFTVHWAIGVAYATVIPTLGGVTFFISRRIKQAQALIVRQTAELAGSTTETLHNVELVKSLGLEVQETKRLNQVNGRILELELSKVKMIRKLAFTQGTLINGLRSAILLLMLYLIYRHDISLGQFFSMLFYSFFIFNPLSEFGNVATQYQEARASLEQLAAVLALEPAPLPEHPMLLEQLTSLEFRSLGFSYASGQPDSLAEVSLTLQPGETIALVGPSGSGKSTVVKLLVGLYEPQRGAYLVNGHPSSTSVDFNQLRQRIGYVSQETQLFAGSIRENLLFVRPTATDEECLAALRSSAALTLIERGGQGLDTKIGEGGLKLSGGERQRLAIARALLRNPDLIIFDEATSSLDSITEASINETIRQVTGEHPNLMTVLVAHRLATVQHADRIYVLEKGRLVEQGTHKGLVQQAGLYAALWREQQAAA